MTAPTGSDCRFSVTGGSSATLLTPSLKFRVKGAVSTTAGTNPDCQFESPGYKLENDNAPAVAGAKYLVMWTFNAARVAAGPYTHVKLILVSKNRPDATENKPLNGGNPLANTGVFQWSVPSPPGVTPDDRYALRLTRTLQTVRRLLAEGVVESAEFSVIGPKPTLGEALSMSGVHNSLTKGSTDVISWSSGGLVGNVDLQLFECHDTPCDNNDYVKSISPLEKSC